MEKWETKGRGSDAIFARHAFRVFAGRIIHLLVTPVILSLLMGVSVEANPSVAQGGRKVGQGVKEVVFATGNAFKESGKAVGRGFKKAGKETGRAFKTMGKDIGRAFSGR